MLRLFDRVAVFVVSFALIIFLSGCDGNRIVDENHEIPGGVWTLENLQLFKFEIPDLEPQYRFLVNVRNSNVYAYSNLYLFVEIAGTDDKFFRDTLEVIIADNSGRWTGSGVGNVWLNQVAFLKAVKMTESGPFTVKIGHGMRNDTIYGISDIGFRVEKI